MTDQEKNKIKDSIIKTKKWWDSLSDEEKKKEAEKSDDTRLWEDWSDDDCVADAISPSSRK